MKKFIDILPTKLSEKKLLELIEKSKDIQNYEIERGLESYTNDSYVELTDFISKAFKNQSSINKNYQIIVNNFDKIFPFIVESNIDIFAYNFEFLMEQPNFKEKFIEGLKKYPYKNSNMFYNITVIIGKEKFNNFIDKDILKTLAESNFDPYFYEEIFNELDNPKQKEFLHFLISNKCNIPYMNLDYKEDNKKVILDNIDLAIKNSENLYFLREFVKEDASAFEKVKKYIDDNEEKAINSIFLGTSKLKGITEPDAKEFLKLLILDIVKNENVKLSDITYNEGGFSRVLLIGNKVLKLGKRYTKNFPNNPYIIAPLLREELKINNETCFMEVTERVDTSKLASEEEQYQLFKNLRDIGLIWTDIKPQNIGRLKKDNIIHWTEDIKPSEETLGLMSKRGDKILKEGDLVLLDADFIFDENDPNINYSNQRQKTEQFEKRYQEEKLELQNISNEENTIVQR